MGFIKKSLLTIGFIIIFALGFIWLLSKTITPVAIKDIINQELSALTNQTSRIDGDVAWQLLPRPRIKINQIKIGSEDTNKRPQSSYSLSADSLLLNIQLSPLFKGNIVFSEIGIEGAKLNVYPTALANHTNDITIQPSLTDPSAPSKKSYAHFAIENFSLTNGQIAIKHPQGNITLTNVQAAAKQINLQKNFFPLKMKGNLNAMFANNKAKANINYTGTVRLPPSLNTTSLDTLQKSSATGQLLLKNVQINALKISTVSATILSNKKRLRLSPLNLQLYNGKAIGDLHYSFPSKELTINQTASNIDAYPLFKSLFESNIARGKVDFSLHNSINFTNPDWQEHVLGTGNFTMKNGRLNFIDLPKIIQTASAKIHALQQGQNNSTVIPLGSDINSSQYQAGKSDFQLLNLQYTLLNARLMNNTFLLQTNTLILKGNSQVNLNNESIKGDLSAKLLTSDSVINTIQQRLGGSFPLTLAGKMSQPIIAPNTRIITPLISKYLLSNSLIEPLKQIQLQVKDIIMTPRLLFLNQ